MTRAAMRDYCRFRLGIKTTLEQYDDLIAGGLSPAEVVANFGFTPAAGQQPPWSPMPSNRMINDAIEDACRTVNRTCNVSGVLVRDIAVAAVTTNGPLDVNLGTLPGYDERSVINLRRAWWFDGTTHYKLPQRVIGDLDRRGATYLDDAPGYPYQCWMDGYHLFIDPAPSSAGTVSIVVGDGLLWPKTDTEGFDPIPESYDPSVLFLAIVGLGKSLPSDTEMMKRAQAFSPDAAQALNDLSSWFNGLNSEESNPCLVPDTRSFRRWNRHH